MACEHNYTFPKHQCPLCSCKHEWKAVEYGEECNKCQAFRPEGKKMPKHLKLWKRPECYVGAEWPEYYVVIGRHRDSALLDNHNFEVIQERLEAIEKKYPEWDNPADHETAMLVNPSENVFTVFVKY